MRNLLLAIILVCIAVAQGAAADTPAKMIVRWQAHLQQATITESVVAAKPDEKCCMKQPANKSAVKSPCTADISSVPPYVELRFRTMTDCHEVCESGLLPTALPSLPFRPPIV